MSELITGDNGEKCTKCGKPLSIHYTRQIGSFSIERVCPMTRKQVIFRLIIPALIVVGIGIWVLDKMINSLGALP